MFCILTSMELLFSSPELKDQVSFSDQNLSVVPVVVGVVVVVVLVVVVVVVNFSHFHLLLQKNWTNFNQTWQSTLG